MAGKEQRPILICGENSPFFKTDGLVFFFKKNIFVLQKKCFQMVTADWERRNSIVTYSDAFLIEIKIPYLKLETEYQFNTNVIS